MHASRKLLAALAVLAVAFVVLAAVPAVADDSDAADEPTSKTYYVKADYDGTEPSDGTEAKPYTTLTAALNAASDGYTIILKSDLKDETTSATTCYGLTGKNINSLKVTKAVAIKSEVGKQYEIPYSVEMSTNGSVTFDNVKIAPTAKGAYAIAAGYETVSEIIINECVLTVTPYADGDGQTPAVYITQTAKTVNVTGSTFDVAADKGNQYTSAVMIWGLQNSTDTTTATITGNTVNGYARFVNIDGVASFSINDNTAEDMVGPLQIGSELKGGMFVQLSSSGVSHSIGGTIKNNTISAASGFQQVVTYPTDDESKAADITTLDTDCDVVFKGAVKIQTSATITGNISLISENGVDANVVVKGAVTATGKNLTIAEDCTMILTGSGASIDSNAKTGDGFLAATSDVSKKPEEAVGAYKVDVSIANSNLSGGKVLNTYYAVGQTVTVTGITAKDNYKVGSVTYTGTDKDGNAISGTAALQNDGSYTFVMPAGDVTVSATAEGAYTATFTLVYDDDAKKSSIVSSQNFADPTSIVSPAAYVKGYIVDGYQFDGWFTDKDCTKKYTSTTEKNNVTIYGLMQKIYTITDATEKSDYGSISVAASSVKDKTITITVSPAADKGALRALYVDNENKTEFVKDGKFSFEMPDHDVTVRAVFEPLRTASVDTPYGENVNSIAIADADREGKLKVLSGTKVVFTITSKTETGKMYTVSEISIAMDGKVVKTLGNGVTAESDGSYSFEMPAGDAIITAKCAPSYLVTITQPTNAGDSKITVKNGETEVKDGDYLPKGTKLTIIATEGSGYGLSTITIDGTAVDADEIVDGKYTHTMGEKGVTISAEFAQTYKVEDIKFTGNGELDFTLSELTGIAGTTLSFGYILGTDSSLLGTNIKAYTDAGMAEKDLYKKDGIELDFTVNKDGTVSFSMPAANIWILVEFTTTQYTEIETVATNNGTLEAFTDEACKSPVGEKGVVAGTKVYFRTTPGTESELVGISAVYTDKDGKTVSVPMGKTADGVNYIEITADMADKTVTVTAEFTAVTKEVTFSGDNATFDAWYTDGKTDVPVTITDGKATVPAGTELFFKVTANGTDNRVASVMVGTTVLKAVDGIYSCEVNDNITITATVKGPVAVTIPEIDSKVGSLKVSVDGEEITNGAMVPYGTELTVEYELIDTTNYTTMIVLFNNTPVENGKTVPVNSDTAAFAVSYDGYVVTPAKNANAVIEVVSDNPVAVGSDVVVKVTVKDHKEAFTGISVNGQFIAKDDATVEGDVYTFTFEVTEQMCKDEDGKKTIPVDAVFEGIEYSITVEKNANATVDVVDKAKSGTTVTVRITVADGYDLTSVKVTGIENALQPAKDGLNTYTVSFAMPAKDVKIAVELDTVDYKEITISGEATKTTEYPAEQVVRVTGNLTLTAGTVLTINGKLIVPAGVTITIAADSELIIKGYADIKGDIVIEEADSDKKDSAPGEILVAGNGQADVFGNVTISGVIGTEGTGKIVFKSGSAAEVSTGADVSATISEAGTIYGNVSIEEDASLTVAGKIGKDATTKFAVEGTLVVDTVVPTAGFAVDIAKDGQLQIESVVLGERIVAAETATSTVKDTTGTVTVTGSELTYTDKDGKLVQKGGNNTVTITADATAPTDADKKTVTGSVDFGALVTGITVSQKASSAVVKSTDSDKAFKDAYRNSYVLTVAGDIAVEGYSDAYQDAPTMTATVTVAVAGAADAAKTNAAIGESSLAAGVTMTTSGKVSVEGAVSVGAGAAFTNNGDLTVKAAVDATAQKTETLAASAFTNNGTVTVSGDGSVVALDEVKNTKNAAYYKVAANSTAKTPATHNYVTIDAALKAVNDGKTKAVDVYGKQTLKADANVPADIVITLKKVGEQTAELTVAEEATLSFDASKNAAVKFEEGTKIVVKGTLSAEKMSNLLAKNSDIVSDVITGTKKADGKDYDTSKAAEWTNVYNALANAKAGSTVTLAQSVDVKKNLVVPAGVTLDADGKTVTVDNDLSLTVKGTLDLRDSTSEVVLVSEDKTAQPEKKAGAIVVEGYVAYGTQDAVPVTGGNAIPGAYYSVTDDKGTVKYLTSYANGIANAAKADANAEIEEKHHFVMFVAGTDGKISLGDFSVTGEKDAPAILAVIDADLIVGTATFTYALIETVCDEDSDAGHEVSGVFADANGSVSVKAKTPFFVVGSIEIAGTATLSVGGYITDYQTVKGVDVDTYVTFSGKLYIGGLSADIDKAVFSASADVAIGYTEDETPVECEAYFGDKTEVSVEGAIVIRAGSSMTAEKLSVSGSIGIEDGKLTASEATVTGSIDAKAEKASAVFDVLYVGVEKSILGKEYVAPTAGDASVVGNVSVEYYILAAPAAVLPEDVVKEDSDYKCTVFNVDDAVYLRGYTPNTNAAPEIYQVVYSKVDARFDGWYVSEDKIATTEKIGEIASVYAKITEDIYVMQITTDGGINYITVDGKLMTANGNVFTIPGLKAGNHVVKFEAKDGYDVSAVKMYAADGSVVDASKIALGGAKVAAYTGTEKVSFELIGSTIAQPDTPEPTPIIIKDDKSDDMSLTDMLLIVLVVLIVIMAAIVALRMMRS